MTANLPADPEEWPHTALVEEVRRLRGASAWRDIATAPRDGTLVLLLVEFGKHATEDVAGPARTIGGNNFDNDGEDVWQFAGWCWSHDHWTEGEGRVIAWAPLHEAPGAFTDAPQRRRAEG